MQLRKDAACGGGGFACRTAQAVRVTVAAHPSESFSGTVKQIAPTVDARSRNGAVQIALGAEALGKLRPGMLAQVGLSAG